MPTNYQRLWAILILILGCISGAILITPLLDLQYDSVPYSPSFLHILAGFLNIRVETLGGAIIGLVVSFLVLPFIFHPDPDIQNMLDATRIGSWDSFVHPTNLPITIAMIWFLSIMGIFYLMDLLNKIKASINLAYILLLPIFFLFGLSGFQMIRRNETVNGFGKIFKGFWAYLNGTLLILFGWGGLLYVLLAWIFHW
jgi:hypothetical protein